MAARIIKMKLWPDENDAQWKQSVQDIQGELLCVSQFTLYASTRKGTKPDFHGAAKPEVAKELYDHFVESVKKLYDGEKVKTGVFQAMMEVALVNDGPVTLQMDTEETRKSGPNTPDTASTHSWDYHDICTAAASTDLEVHCQAGGLNDSVLTRQRWKTRWLYLNPQVSQNTDSETS